jgi:hypothetical protein
LTTGQAHRDSSSPTAVKDLFYQLCDHHQNPVKHDAAELKSEVDDLKRRLGDANEQRRKGKTTTETFGRAIQVLTLENAQLKQRLESVPMTSRPWNRSHGAETLHVVASDDTGGQAQSSSR